MPKASPKERIASAFVNGLMVGMSTALLDAEWAKAAVDELIEYNTSLGRPEGARDRTLRLTQDLIEMAEEFEQQQRKNRG